MSVLLEDVVARGRRIGVALADDELRRIAEHLGRMPTDTELFAFDAQWSEHCSYKSSREHLKKLPTEGPSVLLGVGEDAGIVRLGEWNGETYGIVVAHESHNHPSQVVPFEGAATGVGGIVRDVLCMGAEVIGIADCLRFGRLENEHCRYVAQQVVDGIAAYGNAIGVPNVGGDVFIDESFDDNVLVNVIALGLVKEKEIIHSRAPEGSVGWDIVLVGKATDRSGFGGASFSSLTLDEEDAEANKGAVQVPDPFLKNVLMRATYAVFAQLREQGITAGFKDLGAGGLAGCSAELCAAGGVGAEVELERVSTAQRDLPPEVIAIGETQERLCWIVPPSFTPLLLEIYNDVYSLPRIARGACAVAIGKVTETGRYVAKHRGETVMDVDLAFLTGGVRYKREFAEATPETEPFERRKKVIEAALAARPASLLERLRAVLAHRDIASRATIYQRYDGVVRACTAIPPGFADAGVLVPIPGAPLGVATGVGGNPRYGKVNAKRAAELAVVEAVGNVVAVGAKPGGLTDCLNFGDPTVPEHMGAFVAAVDGLAEAARELGIPFVSGNVSLYNRSSSGRHVAPSPIVSCIGTLDDVARTATGALQAVASSWLVVMGEPQYEFGGSVIAELLDVESCTLPSVRYDLFAAWCAVLHEAYARNIVLGARDISDGGIITVAAEMAIAGGGGVGLKVIDDGHGSTEPEWFAESPGFVVQVADQDVVEFLEICSRHETWGQQFARVTRDGRLSYEHRRNGHVLAEESVEITALREAWETPLCNFYGEMVAHPSTGSG